MALYVYASERGETDVAFAIATILMLLTLVINLAANLVGTEAEERTDEGGLRNGTHHSFKSRT